MKIKNNYSKIVENKNFVAPEVMKYPIFDHFEANCLTNFLKKSFKDYVDFDVKVYLISLDTLLNSIINLMIVHMLS